MVGLLIIGGLLEVAFYNILELEGSLLVDIFVRKKTVSF
jgi:hypothetical protein